MQENKITSNLAFLLATSDNSFKVIAIYIKEYFNKEGLIIRIILNTRNFLAVISKFILLAKTLKQAIRQGR